MNRTLIVTALVLAAAATAAVAAQLPEIRRYAKMRRM
jgi:cytochrome c556